MIPLIVTILFVGMWFARGWLERNDYSPRRREGAEKKMMAAKPSASRRLRGYNAKLLRRIA